LETLRYIKDAKISLTLTSAKPPRGQNTVFLYTLSKFYWLTCFLFLISAVPEMGESPWPNIQRVQTQDNTSSAKMNDGSIIYRYTILPSIQHPRKRLLPKPVALCEVL